MKRAKHRLSHHRLTSFDMGQLVPIMSLEVLPGDTIRKSTSALLRVASLANPVMHPVTVRVHDFFVPTRILPVSDDGGTSYRQDPNDKEWESFWNKDDPDYESQKAFAVTDITAGSLLNHLGLPALSNIDMNVCAWPLFAYNKIWNAYYRDQELQSRIAEHTNTTLQRVCWEKDYFTTARTYPQYGDTTVSIPFQSGLQAPVEGIYAVGTLPTITEATASGRGTIAGHDKTVPFNVYTDEGGIAVELTDGTEASARPKVYADLAEAEGGGIDVNDFRRAIALQKFLEARSRYGARYRDYLRYLGVRPRDGRLSEPEYLGGGKQTIAFSEVLATAEGTSTDVGDMAGHGIAAIRTRPWTRFFEEHGVVLSLISVRPKAMYMENIHRSWFRDTRDDHWQKEYEAFGPQAILDKEIYGAHANETDVFGYADRFREYREHPSTVSGSFATTFDDWHLARELGTTPTLGSDFVKCTPTDRVYNSTGDPELYCMANHSVVARRLVSKRAR